jgi:hypothetical protein
MTTLSRIRQKVTSRDYYLSSHAEEEMADDRLERSDIEHAILRGKIDKKLTQDVRGTRYRIAGPMQMAAWFMLCVDSRRWAALSSLPCIR